MRGDDIQPGVTVIDPKGADIARMRPYRLRITEVRDHSERTGGVPVRGEQFRLNGPGCSARGSAAAGR